MITSMVRKRNDKKWLHTVFKKSNNSDDVEGFTTPTPTTTPSLSCPTPDTVESAYVCEKLKFMLCDVNFAKFKKAIDFVDSFDSASYEKAIALVEYFDTETKWNIHTNADISKIKIGNTSFLNESKFAKFKDILDNIFINVIDNNNYKNTIKIEKINGNEIGAPHFGIGTVWGGMNVYGGVQVHDGLLKAINATITGELSAFNANTSGTLTTGGHLRVNNTMQITVNGPIWSDPSTNNVQGYIRRSQDNLKLHSDTT
jgi:hypothetical protein